MTAYRLLWHDYKYFPYERSLALREVEILSGQKPHDTDSSLIVEGMSGVDRLRRLTYFKGIEAASSRVVPDQALLEASSLVNGQTWCPEKAPFPSLRRQSTRYSAHGLHEYRGKFHPQIVRAIGNLIGAEPGEWILDPFCGSGTTLLESAHIGWNAFGIDINPLAVLIANAKIAAFNASPEILRRECDAILKRLSRKHRTSWRSYLPEPDYLEKWFPNPVLEQLCAILMAIECTRPKYLQEVFRVVLSDICREVSLQDPADLRIRRRKNPAENYPATEIFAKSLRARVASIIEARKYIQPDPKLKQVATCADTRDAFGAARTFLAAQGRTTFDAAITSPPYATAMPYLDTQRLSLALLGLLESRSLRSGEKQLIGNREIHSKERVALELQLLANTAGLPKAVIRFCIKMFKLADDPSHGFRRRNMPALVYKYLADMSAMFESVRPLIRSGGYYALLVGRNTTQLKNKDVMIDTPQLLADVAESREWKVTQMLPFETYHRYDVHQSNSIREEVLVVLQAK